MKQTMWGNKSLLIWDIVIQL